MCTHFSLILVKDLGRSRPLVSQKGARSGGCCGHLVLRKGFPLSLGWFVCNSHTHTQTDTDSHTRTQVTRTTHWADTRAARGTYASDWHTHTGQTLTQTYSSTQTCPHWMQVRLFSAELFPFALSVIQSPAATTRHPLPNALIALAAGFSTLVIVTQTNSKAQKKKTFQCARTLTHARVHAYTHTHTCTRTHTWLGIRGQQPNPGAFYFECRPGDARKITSGHLSNNLALIGHLRAWQTIFSLPKAFSERFFHWLIPVLATLAFSNVYGVITQKANKLTEIKLNNKRICKPRPLKSTPAVNDNEDLYQQRTQIHK